MTKVFRLLPTISAVVLSTSAMAAAPATMNWSSFQSVNRLQETDDFLVGTGQGGSKQVRRISRPDLARQLVNAVSIRDFGAKGDHFTDNHRAITNAITYALANGIGTVLFPDDPNVSGAASIYLDSGSYSFWGNADSGTLLLKGSGKSEWRSTAKDGIFLKGCMLLSDLTIRGPGPEYGVGPYYTNHVGVFMVGATTAWSYQNVRISGFGRGLLTLFSGLNLWSPMISNCKIGIGVGHQSDCWVVSGAYVTTCEIAGVEMGAVTPGYEPANFPAVLKPKGSQNFDFTGLTSGNGVDLIWGGSAPQGVFRTYSERATNCIVEIGHNTNQWHDLGVWEQGPCRSGDLVLAQTTGTIYPNPTNAVRLWTPGRLSILGCNFGLASAKPVIRSMNAAADTSQIVWKSTGEQGKTNLLLSSGVAITSQRFKYNMGTLTGNSYDAFDWAPNPSGYLMNLWRHPSASRGPFSAGWVQNSGDRFSFPRNWVHMHHDATRGYNFVLDGVGLVQSNTVDSVSVTNDLRNVTGRDYVASQRAFFLSTNGMANPRLSWPSTPRTPGEAAFVNSNGTVYLLTSVSNGLPRSSWTKTNKLAL